MSRHHPLPGHVALACVLALGAAACSDSTLPTDVTDVPDALEAKGGIKGPPSDKGGGGGGGGDDGGSGAIVEDFDTWDGTTWTATEHPLGKGSFQPGNVSVADGFLSLTTPAGTYDGGEIMSVEKFRFGTYEARIKASTAPGSLTAFFLYEFSDNNIDEIDIEIVPDYLDLGPHVLFTTWLRSRETNHVAIRAADLAPDFDVGEFHDYRIESERKRVRFYVDDMLVAEFTDGIPTAHMHIMASTWWPTWLDGPVLAANVSAEIDWIRH